MVVKRKRIDAEAKTKGGIIIPDTAQEKPSQGGEIVAVGPGGRDESGKIIPIEASRPATGCCSASGRAPKSGSEGSAILLIMKESDIMGILA